MGFSVWISGPNHDYSITWSIHLLQSPSVQYKGDVIILTVLLVINLLPSIPDICLDQHKQDGIVP